MPKRAPPTYDQAISAVGILIECISNLDERVAPCLTHQFNFDNDMTPAEAVSALAAKVDQLTDMCFEIMIDLASARTDALKEMGVLKTDA